MSFKYEMIPPPAHLAETVNTFYLLQTQALRIDEIMPAYSAQIMLFVSGSMVMHYPVGGIGTAAGPIMINAPQLGYAPCVISGPVTMIGASLTPQGWLALAALPVDEVHDQVLPATGVFGPDAIARLEDAVAACRTGLADPRMVCDVLGAVLKAAPHTVPYEHQRLIDKMTRWLVSGFDPPLAELQSAVGISPRQLQRLSRRYFGVPPAQVLKRHRAIRAAMLLANPALPDALRDEALTAYFDQAHLIRDIRRYTGRTPRQLRTHTIFSDTLNPEGHGEAAEILRQDAVGGQV